MAMLGGECSECCGGWYCCALDACAIAESVSVTIDTPCEGDLVGASKQFTQWGTSDVLYQGATGTGYYRYRQTIVPVSAFKGTHQLTLQPTDPLNPRLASWSKNVTDSAGGVTSLRVEIGVSAQGGGALLFFIQYPNYGWSKNTLSDSLSFKTLAQMPNAAMCFDLEHSPNPNQGEWECYNVDSYGFSAGWSFRCQLDAPFSANTEIRSRQVFYTGVNLVWSCPFSSTVTIQAQ